MDKGEAPLIERPHAENGAAVLRALLAATARGLTAAEVAGRLVHYGRIA